MSIIDMCKLSKIESSTIHMNVYFMDMERSETFEDLQEIKIENRNIKIDVITGIKGKEHLKNIKTSNYSEDMMATVDMKLKVENLTLKTILDLEEEILRIIDEQSVIKITDIKKVMFYMNKGHINGMKGITIFTSSSIRDIIQSSYPNNHHIVINIDNRLGNKILLYSKPSELEYAISVIENTSIENTYFISKPIIDKLLIVLELN